MSQPVPQWWPQHDAIYDINRSYAENANEGPFFNSEFPERIWAPKEEWIDFLGHKIASPLGVPAGPLLNSRWTNFAAKVGFDVITYKTIRSREHAGHPLPNVMYINTEGDLVKSRWGETLNTAPVKPANINDVAITNSFGMPSKDAAFLQEDIGKALKGISEGQVMIVSVVGSATDKSEFVDDFVNTARIAVNAGAPIIEANFSCPNVVTGEGKIYSNPDAVYNIASSMVRSLGDTPLLIKVGVFDDPQQMRNVFKAAARAKVRGIAGINTLSMKVLFFTFLLFYLYYVFFFLPCFTDSKLKVVNEKGEPALGVSRCYSGICGGPIRTAALDWVKQARTIIKEEQLDLALVGCGGIMLPSQFDDFLDAGIF